MSEIRILPFMTRGKISYGVWAFWLPMSVLLLFVNVTAQPGFMSIDCGGKRNHTAQNNIRWVSDANYIDVGEIAETGDVSQDAYGSYLHSLRFFPKPLKKSCYQLPVAPSVPYLLRAWFSIGNYSGFKQLPSFTLSIETLGMLAFGNITAPYDDPWYHEIIFVSSGRVLYLCLIRTSESEDPFINAIELRTLQDDMYRQAKPGTSLHKYARIDLGGKSTVRFSEFLCTTYTQALQRPNKYEIKKASNNRDSILKFHLVFPILLAFILSALTSFGSATVADP